MSSFMLVYEASVVSDSQELNLIRNCLESYALSIDEAVGSRLGYLYIVGPCT